MDFCVKAYVYKKYTAFIYILRALFSLQTGYAVLKSISLVIQIGHTNWYDKEVQSRG